MQEKKNIPKHPSFNNLYYRLSIWDSRFDFTTKRTLLSMPNTYLGFDIKIRHCI